jgi:Phage terminase large subunit (GpA)
MIARIPLVPRLIDALRPVLRVRLRPWAEEHIIIPDEYPSPMKGRYSMAADYLFHEPVEMLDVATVREEVFIKPPQLGVGQNLTIPAAARAIHYGYPVLYCTSEKKFSEEFRIERFLPIVRASPAFKKIASRERETEIYYTNGGMLAFINDKSRTGTKGRPAWLVIADEADGYSFGIFGRLRGRLTRYEKLGGKLLIVSQLDPDAKRIERNGKSLTPVLLEYEDSSQARWGVTDPADGKPFTPAFGFRQPDRSMPTWGVKWDHEGARRKYGVNEAHIAATVHYVTPGGATLTPAEFKKLLPAGHWEHAIPDRKFTKPGFLATCLDDDKRDLSRVVLDFLSAKRKGGADYRTFMLEQFCELPYLEKIELTDRALEDLRRDYPRSTNIALATPYHKALEGCPRENILACDVQASHNGLWWLDADLIYCGDLDPDILTHLGLKEYNVALRDWGHCWTFADVDRIATANKARRAGVDARYAIRRAETYQAALKYKFTPLLGASKSNMSMLWERQLVDTQQGRRVSRTARGKTTIMQLIWQSDTVKHHTFQMLTGDHPTIALLLPSAEYTLDGKKNDVGFDELIRHLTGERLVDGKFQKTHDNHLLDCLNMINLLGKYDRLLPA